MSTPSLSGPSSHSSTPHPYITTPPDTPICTPLHAIYCIDVLSAHFQGRQPINPPFHNASDSFALFVTWDTLSQTSPNGKPALRGCIGNFKPTPLSKGLRDYALVSSLEDQRFSPVEQFELPNLQCSVSLLTPFVPIEDPLAWTVGIHGIHITFDHPTSNRILSATYLPEVAADQGWTKEETVLSAIQKAGYRYKVKVGDAVWKSLRMKIYTSEKAKASWDKYVAWKGKQGLE